MDWTQIPEIQDELDRMGDFEMDGKPTKGLFSNIDHLLSFLIRSRILGVKYAQLILECYIARLNIFFTGDEFPPEIEELMVLLVRRHHQIEKMQ